MDRILYVAHGRRGRDLEGCLVVESQHDRFSAIQATTIDTDFSVWEQPADRQRFDASLPVPLLDTVH
jgi:regulator of extracellular matrix RemA (YlzA/DUF370 family)